jgi:hypothetical protein
MKPADPPSMQTDPSAQAMSEIDLRPGQSTTPRLQSTRVAFQHADYDESLCQWKGGDVHNIDYTEIPDFQVPKKITVHCNAGLLNNRAGTESRRD